MFKFQVCKNIFLTFKSFFPFLFVKKKKMWTVLVGYKQAPE